MGNEDRAENTAGHDGVNVVGQLVSQRKGVSTGTDGAERSGEDDGADKPEDPGHHSARGKNHAGSAERARLLAGVTHQHPPPASGDAESRESAQT